MAEDALDDLYALALREEFGAAGVAQLVGRVARGTGHVDQSRNYLNKARLNCLTGDKSVRLDRLKKRQMDSVTVRFAPTSTR
jgi:hypothetical protein